MKTQDFVLSYLRSAVSEKLRKIRSSNFLNQSKCTIQFLLYPKRIWIQDDLTCSLDYSISDILIKKENYIYLDKEVSLESDVIYKTLKEEHDLKKELALEALCVINKRAYEIVDAIILEEINYIYDFVGKETQSDLNKIKLKIKEKSKDEN